MSQLALIGQWRAALPEGNSSLSFAVTTLHDKRGKSNGYHPIGLVIPDIVEMAFGILGDASRLCDNVETYHNWHEDVDT